MENLSFDSINRFLSCLDEGYHLVMINEYGDYADDMTIEVRQILTELKQLREKEEK